MIDGLKLYPSYKDSGVPWLGQVPAHWDVRRQRNAVDMRVSNVDKHSHDGEQPVRLCNYVDVYKNDRITDRIPFMRATATAEEIERFRLQNGDVLITKGSESWNDIGVPTLVDCDAPDLVCGYHLALLKPRDRTIQGSYLLRVQQSQGVAYQYHVAANGVTRYGLSHDAIKSVLLPVPPLAEQSAIVRFLDHADRRIRRYIGAKKRLIALLNEQKQAIIHRAVTRGLDPGVRLKPSGVEWLGEVPEHWALSQVRRLISFVTSGSRGWADFYSDTGDIFLQSGNLGRSMSLNLTFLQHVRPPQGAEGERTEVKSSDVLVCITGALTGNVVFVDVDFPAPAFVNQHVALVRPNPATIYPRYLAFTLHSEIGRIQFKSGEYGGTKQGLGLNDVKSALIPLPPMEEQAAICLDLDSRIAGLRQAISSAEGEINLLHEYRTRLIADVVTGKLDVREAAARLPEESEEPEPLDEGEATGEDEAESEGADLDALSEEAVA